MSNYSIEIVFLRQNNNELHSYVIFFELQKIVWKERNSLQCQLSEHKYSFANVPQIGVLKIFAKFTGKDLCRSLSINKAAVIENFKFKKDVRAQ